jgi:hypothetical protein
MEPDGTHWEHQIPKNPMPSLPSLDHPSPKKENNWAYGVHVLAFPHWLW